MPGILATWEAEIGRITVLGQSEQIVHNTPIFKIIRTRGTGGMVQVLERLLCKCKVLVVQTPVSPKNKKQT
jgi:hypothetical protein